MENWLLGTTLSRTAEEVRHIHSPVALDNNEQAQNSRERIANHEATHGYYEQERMREGWEFGTPKPASLVIGELHDVSRAVTQQKPTVERNGAVYVTLAD